MFIKCADAKSEDLYKILIGSVVPRPIAWVSSQGKNGADNLAPFSFFNCFGVHPPMVGFAPAWKEIEHTTGGADVRVPKDTMKNIQETGEFVVNIVSRSVAEQMNLTSAAFAADVDEFQRANLTKEPSQFVAPPAVREALINYECKLIQLLQHGNNNLVIGEIVAMRIADHIINDRFHIDGDGLDAVGRLGGNWYATTRDKFELRRPKAD